MQKDVLLSIDTKVILLLCGVLGKESNAQPLTQSEYTSLVRSLIKFEMRPCDLLNSGRIPEIAENSKLDNERLDALLSRGVQLGFAVEEWDRNGIWVISRSEADYPVLLKKHLKDKAPPLLFCIGNPNLLSGGGIAIVGSRNVDKQGELFARQVARQCAMDGMPVVSGGARGVDQIAMNASMEVGGITIGVIADNLLKKSLERNARKAISSGKLLLLSPYHPKAGFKVATAMARNKLIYAMADYAVVVSAEAGQGGTWAGAGEELKRENSRPVFVRSGEGIPSGNSKLLELGAMEWPELNKSEHINQQLSELTRKRKSKSKAAQQNLFDFTDSEIAVIPQDRETDNPYNIDGKIQQMNEAGNIPPSVYEAVLPVILSKLSTPKSSGELAEQLDVTKAQLNKWLAIAVEDKAIRKLSRPVRYALPKENNS